MTSLQENFEKLREKVLVKRPVLREILKKRGMKNLFDYAKLYIDVNLNPPIKKRQDELIGAFKAEAEKILGAEIAESGAKQLAHYYFASTVDHHSPLLHPFFLNGNLLTAAPHFEHSDPLLKNVIVLAFGSISLNNSSFPRGFLFNTYTKGRLQTQRLSFFPASDRLCPVYNFRGFTMKDLEKIKKFLNDMVRNDEVHQPEAEKIHGIIDEIYARPEILEIPTYSEQISKSNFHLWKKFFEVSKVTPPNLIYLEIESLVNRLLIDYHIFNHTIITHFLFDTEYDELIYKYFEGIMGAFSRTEKWGTYLFWALPKGAKYRMQVWKEGNYLVTEDHSYKIELTPESIKKALDEKELLPSMMLCFIVLCFYYGLKCLGGFSQTNYLTFMKNAYIKMQVDLGNYRSIEVCARAQTKEMGGDFTIAFLGGPKGEMVPATGLDLILYGNERTWPCLVEESKLITLEDGVSALMPEFYRILYAEPERDNDLMAVSADDIAKLIHLDEKIKPCVEIKA